MSELTSYVGCKAEYSMLIHLIINLAPISKVLFANPQRKLYTIYTILSLTPQTGGKRSKEDQRGNFLRGVHHNAQCCQISTI